MNYKGCFCHIGHKFGVGDYHYSGVDIHRVAVTGHSHTSILYLWWWLQVLHPADVRQSETISEMMGNEA